jgi:hypothetical protein
MGGMRVAIYALLLLMVLLVVAGSAIYRPSDAPAEDADLVYCLAPGHVKGLVNAAEALGLVTPGPSLGTLRSAGQELSLARWQVVDHSDFRRACDAYAAADDSAGTPSAQAASGLEPLLVILLPVLAAALLAMLAGDIKQAGDRRWVQADELRADWREFEDAVDWWVAQARKNEGIPETGDVEAKRRLFAATLRKVRSQHRRSTNIRKLSDDFDGLGGSAALAHGWDDPEGRAREITGSLASIRALLEQVASALERGVWPSWRK